LLLSVATVYNDGKNNYGLCRMGYCNCIHSFALRKLRSYSVMRFVIRILFVSSPCYMASKPASFYMCGPPYENITINAFTIIVTGPHTHNVGGPVLFCCMTSVVVCNTPWRRICSVTHQGLACDGGPVVLRPVMAALCLKLFMTSSLT